MPSEESAAADRSAWRGRRARPAEPPEVRRYARRRLGPHRHGGRRAPQDRAPAGHDGRSGDRLDAGRRFPYTPDLANRSVRPSPLSQVGISAPAIVGSPELARALMGEPLIASEVADLLPGQSHHLRYFLVLLTAELHHPRQRLLRAGCRSSIPGPRAVGVLRRPLHRRTRRPVDGPLEARSHHRHPTQSPDRNQDPHCRGWRLRQGARILRPARRLCQRADHRRGDRARHPQCRRRHDHRPRAERHGQSPSATTVRTRSRSSSIDPDDVSTRCSTGL